MSSGRGFDEETGSWVLEAGSRQYVDELREAGLVRPTLHDPKTNELKYSFRDLVPAEFVRHASSETTFDLENPTARKYLRGLFDKADAAESLDGVRIALRMVGAPIILGAGEPAPMSTPRVIDLAGLERQIRERQRKLVVANVVHAAKLIDADPTGFEADERAKLVATFERLAAVLRESDRGTEDGEGSEGSTGAKPRRGAART